MADGDIYDQHGRQGWKTCARKLFRGDDTFEGSAIWSIDNKMLRVGNLTAVADLARLITEALRLRDRGIDNQILVDIRLRQIEQTHLDLDSQTAIGIARALSVDAAFALEVDQMSGNDLLVRVAQELLGRVAIETSCTPDLAHALHHEPGRDQLSSAHFRSTKDRGIRLLGQSESVKQRASRLLQDHQAVIDKPVILSRPRASVDHQALVHEAFSVSQ